MNRPVKYLAPKPNWMFRKALVWLFLGPLNPVSWTVIYIIEGELQPFGVMAFFMLWPCCLGATIGLWRLKQRPLETQQLTNFVLVWSILTLLLYPFVVIMAFPGVPLYADAASFGWFLLQTILVRFFVALFVLPFALLYGTIPAVWAALMAYGTIRVVLFRRTSPQLARP